MTDRPDLPGPAAPRPAGPRPPDQAVQRWRLVVSRAAGEAGQAQRALLLDWETALRACGLPIAGLDSGPRKLRFAFGAPLAASIPGEAELLDVWLVERLPRWRVREALESRLPAGNQLRDVHDVWLGEAALPGQVVASVYRAELVVSAGEADALRAAASAVCAAPAVPRARRKGEGTVAYDLRPFVDGVEVTDDAPAGRLVIRMVLRHDPEKGVGRPEELLAELGDRIGTPLAPGLLVRERLVLASERVAQAGHPAAGSPGVHISDGVLHRGTHRGTWAARAGLTCPASVRAFPRLHPGP